MENRSDRWNMNGRVCWWLWVVVEIEKEGWRAFGEKEEVKGLLFIRTDSAIEPVRLSGHWIRGSIVGSLVALEGLSAVGLPLSKPSDSIRPIFTGFDRFDRFDRFKPVLKHKRSLSRTGPVWGPVHRFSDRTDRSDPLSKSDRTGRFDWKTGEPDSIPIRSVIRTACANRSNPSKPVKPGENRPDRTARFRLGQVYRAAASAGAP
ncbi:hypothetical protein PIB30_022355 [Stylosanthes scabra]|uniref:Uncharacterized protein n=1 Tax=Stylosanthes scabra TaxID=79078 RepID=A0ABU6W736_9FABA|nr:hypothetical protein [Stylosanthes scabra]